MLTQASIRMKGTKRSVRIFSQALRYGKTVQALKQRKGVHQERIEVASCPLTAVLHVQLAKSRGKWEVRHAYNVFPISLHYI